MTFFFFSFCICEHFCNDHSLSPIILFVRLLVGEFFSEINSLNPDVAWMFFPLRSFCFPLPGAVQLTWLSGCRSRSAPSPSFIAPLAPSSTLRPVCTTGINWVAAGVGEGIGAPLPCPGVGVPRRAQSDALHRASGSSTSVRVWPFSRHHLSRAANDPVVFFHARFLAGDLGFLVAFLRSTSLLSTANLGACKQGLSQGLSYVFRRPGCLKNIANGMCFFSPLAFGCVFFLLFAEPLRAAAALGHVLPWWGGRSATARPDNPAPLLPVRARFSSNLYSNPIFIWHPPRSLPRKRINPPHKAFVCIPGRGDALPELPLAVAAAGAALGAFW